MFFGRPKPFGKVQAYLGKILAQSGHSPHLHLLVRLAEEERFPDLPADRKEARKLKSEYLETFSTGIVPIESDNILKCEVISTQKISVPNTKTETNLLCSIDREVKKRRSTFYIDFEY